MNPFKKSLLAASAALTSASLGLSAQTYADPTVSADQTFADLTVNADGSFNTWFGTFSQEGNPASPALPGTIDHAEHGLLVAYEAGAEALWLYDANLATATGLPGWIFASEVNFPYLYIYAGDDSFWLRYVSGVAAPGPNSRIFVDLAGTAAPTLLPKVIFPNIVGTAQSVDALSTLVAAVLAADPSIATALSADGALTVFAPTNDAFAAIQSTVDTLLEPANQGLLNNVLLYHVVAGSYSASDLGLDVADVFLGESATRYIETLAGTEIRVDITPFGVTLNGSSSVIMPNVRTSNGIVHVISEVLIPPANIATVATNAGFSTLVAAVGAADPAVAAALTGDGPLTVFAPTNEAFAAIQATVDTLLEPANQAALTNILLYHTVAGKFYANDVPLDTAIATNAAGGATIVVTQGEDGKLYVNGIEILSTNITAGNGVIHVIAGVLVPTAG